MACVAQVLTQEPIYKLSSIFCFKPVLLSAHKLILLIYGDNASIGVQDELDDQEKWVLLANHVRGLIHLL